ncbi:hypothetical protein Scep_009845 [Stephania cephalantha]|uniref:Uncharacterized protein n=1 Tax=Stephania cephalantha TaxID=152367 RepID=A0AAP0JUR1_9MAGN
MLRCEELKNEDGCREPRLSLLKSLIRNLTRLPRFTVNSLSLSIDPFTVGASAVAASCRRVCRRWCRLPSLPRKPSPTVVAASEAIAVCLRPLPPLFVQPAPLVAAIRRCVGNHHRLPSLSAAAGCAAPSAVRRRCRGNYRPLPHCCRVQPRLMFVALRRCLENHRRQPSPLTTVVAVQPRHLFTLFKSPGELVSNEEYDHKL